MFGTLITDSGLYPTPLKDWVQLGVGPQICGLMCFRGLAPCCAQPCGGQKKSIFPKLPKNQWGTARTSGAVRGPAGRNGALLLRGGLADQHEVRLRLQRGLRAARWLGAVQECEDGRAGAGSQRRRLPTQKFSDSSFFADRWVSMFTPEWVDVLGVCLCVRV